MQVYQIPVLSDNYIFLLHDPDRQTAAVVDPARAEPVLQQLSSLGAELTAIFNTHHHNDHIGGNQQLIDRFRQIKVYGGAQDRGRIPGQQVFLQAGDRVEFAGRTAEVFFVPGHTKAHIAYYFPARNQGETGELFCGDTLFAGGCGRLKEGTPAQMLASLEQLRNLPDSTRVWCAHEYTLQNLQFAIGVDGDNPDLQQRLAEVKEARSRSQPTIPSSIGIEKKTNPFLRWDLPNLQSAANTRDPVQTFAQLRAMKDRF
ncbi:hydroxyacylglutathione hydrolase [Tychonema sp. LEGE 06208]|uniref:hydroxyacylglutathione hydrolase n=1 Tax=Tychonema sp. LEGE 06208 TaxID=1828663 RepID=UPI00187F7633|nr:hydroxyacylglutathione hydrolase [Tychonema sp. LEGE 06208]MBE9163505.1 hydroxyacylglutathione hydrolase [Tychonema sp. LEGE 06208]